MEKKAKREIERKKIQKEEFVNLKETDLKKEQKRKRQMKKVREKSDGLKDVENIEKERVKLKDRERER